LLDTALMTAQLDIEQRSTAEGYARFIKEQEAARKHEGPFAQADASKVIAGCIPLVAAEIERWIAASARGGKGKTHTAITVLKRFDLATLAFIALNQVFSGCISQQTLPRVLVHIGTVVEGEVIAQNLGKDQGQKVADRIRQQINKQGSASNRRKAFNKLTKGIGQKHVDWEHDYKARIGEPLVGAVLRALPQLFELATSTRGRGQMMNHVRLTQEGVELLMSIKDRLAWAAPVLRPMVVKPRPWEAFDSGCYYDEKAARNVRLVRTYDRDQQRRIRHSIKDGSMASVLEALNAIQDTPWAINTEVLEVLKHCWSRDVPVPGLPANKLVTLPDRMVPEAYAALSDFERKGVRINIAQLREKNRGIVADRAVMLRDLDTAKELSTYDRFYLPHSLDFRGRVYPVCHFSHQRSDAIKALFRFADGCRYGPYGGAWASIHLANVGDFGKVSKRSFDARLDWVLSAKQRIIETARDPIANLDWWTQADSPFMFLAACFEYHAWVQSGKSEDFSGHLPVALDGSNSGLQHYSAALRSQDEAALVSLTPSDEPADLYQTVADAVEAEVRREAPENPLAQLALDIGITRNLVKRNVMTFAYSSAQFGFRQQLIDDTMRPLNDAVLTGVLDHNPWNQEREDGTEDGGWQAANYLSRKVWSAVTSVVTDATGGMDFFKQTAGILARYGMPLDWTSPLGLPCTHAYRIWNTKAVQLFLYDRAVPVVDAGPRDKVEGEDVIRQVRANIRTRPTEALDKDKARSAVAPNIIHSMDGSHLMLCVIDAKDQDIKHLALIHDSFGAHAGRTAEFSGIIRQAFVNLYENYDPFQEVYDSAKDALDGDPEGLLPQPPTKGTFDLNDVLNADYAFA
jgi:DNA-directed RNA polymerase, mitochondrial